MSPNWFAQHQSDRANAQNRTRGNAAQRAAEDDVMTWTDERPTEPGEYWVSIPPQRRMQYAHKCVVLPVVVKHSRGGPLVVGLIGTTGFWEVADAQLDDAKWSRRETPADPFEVTK